MIIKGPDLVFSVYAFIIRGDASARQGDSRAYRDSPCRGKIEIEQIEQTTYQSKSNRNSQYPPQGITTAKDTEKSYNLISTKVTDKSNTRNIAGAKQSR
jgi:hypothetical protein